MHLSITLWQIWLTVGAVCVALLRVIPKVQPIVTPWLPPRWRTVPGLLLAFAGMVVGVAQAGSDVEALTTAIVLGLVAIAGVFAPGALPAGAVAEPGVSLAAATKEITALRAASKAGSIPPTAVLLVIGLVGFGQSGCAGRLDNFRPKTASLSVAGVALEQPGSPRCQTLDSRQLGLGIAGYTATGVGAALAAGELVPNESKELRVGLAIGAITATAAGGGLLWGRQATVDEYISEGCAGESQ